MRMGRNLNRQGAKVAKGRGGGEILDFEWEEFLTANLHKQFFNIKNSKLKIQNFKSPPYLPSTSR